MRYDYDLLVIGSGSAGFSAAQAARGTGRKIGIVESGRLGGECPNWACVPTKTLLKSASVFRAVQNASDYGVRVERPTLSFASVMKRRAQIVSGLGGKRMEDIAHQLGFDIVRGHATFVDPHTIHVDGKEITAARFVIATGTKTRVPTIPGLDGVSWMDFKDAASLEKAPASMVIIGGGPVGCEFATFYNAVGTQVTLLQGAPRVLHREEPEVSDVIVRQLSDDGVAVHVSSEVVRAQNDGDAVTVTARIGKGLETFAASSLLLATGKRANVDGLGLQAAGVKVNEQGHVVVNTQLKTSADHIWAAGDVNGGMQFTHVAHREGSIAGHNAFAKKTAQRMDDRVIPRATFVHPEVASVGLTEAQAREKVSRVLVGTFDMRMLGRAYIDGTQGGLVKIVADGKTHKVLGGHIVGERAGELVHEIALAMHARLKVDDLASMVHAYPTYSEAVTAAAAMALQ